MFFDLDIFSLSNSEKSPSGPIKTHVGFFILIFFSSNFFSLEFKSPKIILISLLFLSFNQNNNVDEYNAARDTLFV